ncbi:MULTISPECIES: ABC transporter ATP-binding protein [Flavobacterium]|uniref:ABC transporter ATP-binding protein n=1 Tax=Flavobacterium keumense TaxID=1306518 RepID=A0ABY8N1T5_9FLAO|nr:MULTISPECIES: ABC transporter ATP-binding protein [Flavobacterium]WGK93625.1 ABC transporter ATP-binding protein [Flavobacterium keumense]
MLELKDITFTYIDQAVINGLSFVAEQGQNIAVIGESGCGKSTLLKLIYGLYDLDSGTINYNGNPILGPKYNLIPGEDYIKYLAQDFDLMPYITVEENVGKFLSNIYRDKKKARVQELLEMVEMTEFAKVKAQYLSGGQQQRVALARVLALEPQILLLDEPFSQIDAFRKNALRRNVFQYLKKKKITCIIATHDSTDALSFSDETIVMQHGKIIVKDAPQNLYRSPQNKYIASLFGEVNELELNGKLHLVYPHQLKLDPKGKLKCVVQQSYFKGGYYLVEASSGSQTLFFENDTFLPSGASIRLEFLNKTA